MGPIIAFSGPEKDLLGSVFLFLLVLKQIAFGEREYGRMV